MQHLFPGDSELACRMRAFDWSRTDLGSPTTWPQNLRTALGICLTSRFPMNVWWGQNLTLFYNDAYISFLGKVKHPAVLGRSGWEAWSEIWDTIAPMIEKVFTTATATWSEDILMFFDRELPREEVYVTFSFSPVLGKENAVDGMFCACTETTEKLVANRRLETLRKLGVSAAEARSVGEACQAAADVLRNNPHDLPFAGIYVAGQGGTDAQLVTSAGLGPDSAPLPAFVSLADSGGQSPWPLASVLRSRSSEETADLNALGIKLPGGPWPEPSRKALVLPIRAPAPDSLAGLLVVGVSPRRPLDAAYRAFLDLIAGQIGTALADARAYEDERRRADALAELDRARTAFFSNVSHEFRTPLTLMLGPLEDALQSRRLPSEHQAALEVVHRNGLRLLKLVNSLLDFSRLEAGRVEAIYEPTDLAKLTAELASVFRSAIERADLRLVVDCPPLPDVVYVDRDKWEKIVLNLVSNAFKFTFSGEIEVRIGTIDTHAVLTVRDTGAGIPAEELPHVFERFHRVPSARARTHEGTGIGLALVNELVKLHSGIVTVESQEDRGTTFRVMVPFGRSHLDGARIGAARTVASTAIGAMPYIEEALRWLPEDMALSVPEKRISSGAADEDAGWRGRAIERAEGTRILLADDNADMRDYVRRLLGQHWTVLAVADGLTALAAARARVPDLVLTDVMMPGLDGFELLRELRRDARTRNVPVILLSARAGEESKVEGFDSGADDYLIKPFSGKELLARVNAHLSLARVRAQVISSEAARRQAEAASSAKDEFLAMLGHELRNPLFAISAASELIDSVPEAQQRRVREIMRHEVRHLARLVDDLLDAGRVAMGKIVLSREPLDLSATIDQQISALRAEGTLTQELTLTAEPAWVDADETRIEQLVSNLLTNARKFTPRGGRIAVTVRADGPDVIVRVEDTGVGIAPDTLPRIFELFVQGEATLERARGGLGIGLTLVKRIAELHGGNVEAFSPGRGLGSVFTVRLPRIEKPATKPASAQPAPVTRGLRILVIEDNHSAREMLAALLSHLGNEVHEATDGPSGVEAALRLSPDVAIVDIGLPGLDGYRVAEQIRQRQGRPDMQLVALTGYGQPEDRDRAFKAGFHAHLVKPVDRNQLVEVLGGGTARGELRTARL